MCSCLPGLSVSSQSSVGSSCWMHSAHGNLTVLLLFFLPQFLTRQPLRVDEKGSVPSAGANLSIYCETRGLNTTYLLFSECLSHHLLALAFPAPDV